MISDCLHTAIFDMSSKEYHGVAGTFSSSQFKDLLKSEEYFVKKHIKKEIEREESDAFDVGNYFHTGVLEPHKLKVDCIVYPGKIRRGAEWDAFKKKNKDKAIVTQFQKDQALGLIGAVEKSKHAEKYLDGKSEVSLFVNLFILDDEIYAPYFGKVLTNDGWVNGPKKVHKDAYQLTVKVRADNLGKTYISDLKSTSGDATDEDSVHASVKRWGYQLSGALYLDMFSLIYPQLKQFWLIFASKDLFNCKCWEIEPDKIKVGRKQYMKAIRKFVALAESNFEMTESTGTIRVLPEERHWLDDKDIELL